MKTDVVFSCITQTVLLDTQDSVDLHDFCVNSNNLQSMSQMRFRPVQQSVSFHLNAVEVVHGQDGAPLVLIADKTETFGFSGLLVTHQVDVDDLSIPDRTRRKAKWIMVLPICE